MLDAYSDRERCQRWQLRTFPSYPVEHVRGVYFESTVSEYERGHRRVKTLRWAILPPSIFRNIENSVDRGTWMVGLGRLGLPTPVLIKRSQSLYGSPEDSETHLSIPG
jgi:hypothetical protein